MGGENRTAGGCRRNDKRERKRGGQKGRDEESSYCKKKKKRLTDEMQSKWVPIRRMAWKAFPQPPNNIKPQGRGRLSVGLRRPKGKARGKREGSLESKWTKTQKRESWK